MFEISNRWHNAYNTNPNYNWFLSDYINNTTKFQIDKTSEQFGTICMPTGTGKSGETYKAIVNYINDAMQNNKRIIINISSPLLKLNQQLSLDMMFVLLELYCNTTSPYYCNFADNMQFFFNSSESNPGYALFMPNKKNDKGIDDNLICTAGITPYNFYEDFGAFINGNKQIAIVCSCHKSLPNFITYISDHDLKSKGFEIKNFLDESHTVTDRSFAADESVKVDIDMLCKYSTGCFAISATPDINITKTINKYSNNYKDINALDDPYFIHVFPADAVHAGLIVPPFMDVWQSSYHEITDKMIEEIYKDAPVKNPTVEYHKILVNCPVGDNGDLKKIKQIYNNLTKHYKDDIKTGKLHIYMTSSYEGLVATTNEQFNNMKDFTSSIDNVECDCIILHVKQMIAGIDISSITQTVMFLPDVNETVMRTIIQTCGRCLRIGPGDRDGKYAKPKEERKKQYGLCSFIILDDDYETENKLKEFFMHYYMLDDIKFSKQYLSCTSRKDVIGHPPVMVCHKKFTFENLPFTVDVKNYLIQNKERLKRKLRTNSVDETILACDIINILTKNNTAALMDNREVVKLVRENLTDIKNEF